MAIFIGISSFLVLSSLIPQDSLFKNRFNSRVIIFLIIGLFLVYIPFLNVIVIDMKVYVAVYQSMHSLSLFQTLQFFDWEPLFLLFQWIISRFSDNGMFFVICAFLFYFLMLYKSTLKLFTPWQQVYAIFLFFCYPFFYDYIFNGMRQGLAMMLLMLAMAYFIEKKHSFKFYILAVAAGLFHSTAFIFSFVLFIVFAFKFKLRTVLIAWLVSAVLFLTGLNGSILRFNFINNIGYVDEYTSSDLLNAFGGETNKITFFIFSSFFLFLSIFLYKKINLEEAKREVYLNIIKCYAAFNTVFLLLGFIAFSNRIAAYSWHIIPLLVIYPILHQKKDRPLLLFLLILAATVIGLISSPFIEYG